MRFQTTSGGGLAQCALDAHQSECALGVNAPNRIRCASNSLPSASVNGPELSPYQLPSDTEVESCRWWHLLCQVVDVNEVGYGKITLANGSQES